MAKLFKTILVTGANGLLGQKLINKLAGRDAIKLVATSSGENRNPRREGYEYMPLDITSPEMWEEAMEKFEPDEIIHTAAMTNVDQCEKERDTCRRINTDAVEVMAAMCSKFSVRLIHVSTDFIFDGENGPLRETDRPNPVSWYGQCKLEAEHAVLTAGIDHAIARTELLYGVVPGMSRSNIVLWARNALMNKQQIRVVNDQFRSPTLAEDLADGLILLSMKGKQGIWHLSGPETYCIVDLVRAVAQFWELDESLISETDSSSLGQAAKRPPKTPFIILKAQTELGYKPRNLREGLSVLDKQLADLRL